MGFELPTEKTRAIRDLGDATILIHGEKKIGKTSLAAQFPEAFFIFTENGGKGLDLYCTTIDTWPEFIEILRTLKTDDRFKTVVIDTIDRLYDMCFNFVCKEQGMEHPSEKGYGAGWNAIWKEFSKYVGQFIRLPDKGKIFTSHTQDANIEARGMSFSKLIPTYGTQVAKLISAEADVIAYYGYVGTERFIIIEGSQNLEAGSRLGNNFWLATPEGATPETELVRVTHIPAGNNEREAFRNFRRAFNNKQVENPDIDGRLGLDKKTFKQGKQR